MNQLVEDLARRGGLDAEKSNIRIPFNVQVNVGYLRDAWFKKILSAWAFDLSRDGIGLITDRALAVGETFMIEMPSAFADEEQVVPARVVYSFKLFGSLNRVGLTFEDGQGE